MPHATLLVKCARTQLNEQQKQPCRCDTVDTVALGVACVKVPSAALRCCVALAATMLTYSIMHAAAAAIVSVFSAAMAIKMHRRTTYGALIL